MKIETWRHTYTYLVLLRARVEDSIEWKAKLACILYRRCHQIRPPHFGSWWPHVAILHYHWIWQIDPTQKSNHVPSTQHVAVLRYTLMLHSQCPELHLLVWTPFFCLSISFPNRENIIQSKHLSIWFFVSFLMQSFGLVCISDISFRGTVTV